MTMESRVKDQSGVPTRGAPEVPGELVDEPGAVAPAEWRAWMRAFGRRVRTIRDFLGLSQEQVAKAAGVSQGAVSRLEAAQGLATPHLVVLKIQQVLARGLQAIDPTLLNDELRRAIDVARTFDTPLGGGDLPITEDPYLQQFVGLYQQIPERHRESLLMLLRAAVDGLKTTGT